MQNLIYPEIGDPVVPNIGYITLNKKTEYGDILFALYTALPNDLSNIEKTRDVKEIVLYAENITGLSSSTKPTIMRSYGVSGSGKATTLFRKFNQRSSALKNKDWGYNSEGRFGVIASISSAVTELQTANGDIEKTARVYKRYREVIKIGADLRRYHLLKNRASYFQDRTMSFTDLLDDIETHEEQHYINAVSSCLASYQVCKDRWLENPDNTLSEFIKAYAETLRDFGRVFTARYGIRR